jgi:hypothetical protein
MMMIACLFPNCEIPEEVKKLEKKLVESILNEIINTNITTKWSDISGLKYAKESVYEAVV